MSLIGDTLRTELIRAYRAPERHYHDLRHVETLLALARQHGAALSDPDAVEAAIWFHDAIYDVRRDDNEQRSAELAGARLAGAASDQRIACIAAMIRATAGHVLPTLSEPGTRADCALFLDMDLAVLGSPPAEFAAYEGDVRREYAFLSEPQWIVGRRRVLENFLARPTIFLSEAFRRTHEDPARQNLAQALARLGSPPATPHAPQSGAKSAG
jgi:predicted metal-dependent HD superfamily phosphohydrolase